MNDRISPPTFSPARGIAHVTMVTLGLAGAAWAALAVWHLRLAAAGMPASGPPDQGDGVHRPLNALENGYHMVGNVRDLATVICAITFIAWLWRVRDNALALSGVRPAYAWPWIYLGWVVPIVNLWVPRGIIAGVHRAGDPGRPLPRILNWWWACWLLGVYGGVGLVYADSTDHVIERAYTDVGWLLAADAAVIAAAVTAAFLVKTITDGQYERAGSATTED
ncbi:DUF4328 domain-containing protein [Streptomyces sp. NPDC058045]|uniref:DUF4328 domain-containing protein n=1 Tax=Streptomyces sp. NPDC058045 TaxID=3346311 RepID=UPI0036E0E53A